MLVHFFAESMSFAYMTRSSASRNTLHVDFSRFSPVEDIYPGLIL